MILRFNLISHPILEYKISFGLFQQFILIIVKHDLNVGFIFTFNNMKMIYVAFLTVKQYIQRRTLCFIASQMSVYTKYIYLHNTKDGFGTIHQEVVCTKK